MWGRDMKGEIWVGGYLLRLGVGVSTGCLIRVGWVLGFEGLGAGDEMYVRDMSGFRHGGSGCYDAQTCHVVEKGGKRDWLWKSKGRMSEMRSKSKRCDSVMAWCHDSTLIA